jgi:hypothetical protein
MRKQYDFSASRKNPYAPQLKKPVTIRLDEQSITYFKSMSAETGIPYQSHQPVPKGVRGIWQEAQPRLEVAAGWLTLRSTCGRQPAAPSGARR